MNQSAEAAKPLAFMSSLSPFVAYFDPGPTTTPNTQAPHFILVLAWMDAHDSHIAKYITKHRSLFPGSRILLVRLNFWAWTIPSLRKERLKVAIPVLRELAAMANPENHQPQFLLHTFSNGGVASATTLWDLWASELDNARHIPHHVSFVDSGPGFFNYRGDVHAVQSSLPSWARPFVHLLVAITWVLWFCAGRKGQHENNATFINSPIFMSQEVRRTYVYGTADKTVSREDIEAHATKAQGKGAIVRMEKFEGGAHVSQVRVDGDRYWNLLKQTWVGN